MVHVHVHLILLEDIELEGAAVFLPLGLRMLARSCLLMCLMHGTWPRKKLRRTHGHPAESPHHLQTNTTGAGRDYL